MADEIINRVAESGLITLDLGDFWPREEIPGFDLAPFLFQGLVLREKDFRKAMADEDWSRFAGRCVSLFCSADAIVPAWAYMLVVTYLQPYATEIIRGTEEEVRQNLMVRRIRELDAAPYSDQRVVIKGCGDFPVGESAYIEITKKLRPVVKSLMYGEPCSTVPLFKKK